MLLFAHDPDAPPDRDTAFHRDAGVGAAFSACLRCGSDDIWPEIGPGPYGLYCRACGWGGPRRAIDDNNPGPALAAWNDEARKVALAREMGLTINLDQPKGDADGCC